MINKKVLVLTAAMAPMLGLADVGASDHNSRSQSQKLSGAHGVLGEQQQNHIVVTIDGKEFSQYDAMRNVIKIDQNTFSLNLRIGESDTIGNFLRIRHPREAAELGMYENILNDPFSSDSYDNLEETWCEFLMSRAPEVALFLNLYTPANLDKIMNKGGDHAFDCERYKGLTFREFLISSASPRINNVKIWQAICGKILNDPVSRKFLKAEIQRLELDTLLCKIYNSNLLWKEFFCYFEPKIAEKMGLFTKEILDREIHPLLVERYSKPTQPSIEGLSLREYLHWQYSRLYVVEADSLPEGFLDKPLPQQIVQQEPDKYTGLNWRSFLYKFREVRVLKLNLEPGFAVYNENFKLSLGDYMRFYRTEDALKYGLYEQDVIDKLLPQSIPEIYENHTFCLTWRDYKPRGIWFFRRNKTFKDFKDEF